MLAGNHSQPCGELTSIPKYFAVRDGGHHCRCDQRPHTFHGGNLLALRIVLEHSLNPLAHGLPDSVPRRSSPAHGPRLAMITETPIVAQCAPVMCGSEC